MADATSTSATTAAAKPDSTKPPRNPLERVIVWGLILIGVVVIVFEGKARMAYSSTQSNLDAAIARSEDSEADPLVVDKLPDLLVGDPKQSEEAGGLGQTIHLEWSGLVKTYRLHVHVGKHSRLITSYTTDNPPPEEPLQAAAGAGSEASEESSEQSSEGDSSEGGGDRPAGGFGGGGPRPDPMASDADGDGRLSREEAPGRMAEFFDAIDTNGDGFIDAAELEARRNARRGGGEGGPRGGGGGDGEESGRQRPELDSTENPAAPADAATTEAATETQHDEASAPSGETVEK